MNILSAIDRANNFLKLRGVNSSKLDCEILISKVLKTNRSNIILNMNKNLTNDELSHFNDLINERSKKKPIAYLTGKKEFWKYKFHVTRDVLIPRPDTELIIEKVLELTTNKTSINLLDIGTGSGCIILSILKEKNSFYGTGIDISKKSLKICKINADNLGVINRLKLFESDIDNFRYGKYDLIISNPPYIKKLDLKYLEKDVIGYEPITALNGGLDGLSEIRKVINGTAKLIKKKGFLILEIGKDQTEKVKSILKEKGFFVKKIYKDLARNNRCILSTKI